MPQPSVPTLRDASALLSPSLLLFRERLQSNLTTMLEMAGSAKRLRPHCKTHKMEAVARIEIELGITQHKAATIAECEMLAMAGASDVLLSYSPVGPNVGRVMTLCERFPNTSFAITADHPDCVDALAAAAADSAQNVRVFLDLDSGMGRTGIAPGPDALALADRIARAESLTFGGLHAYDGHHRQPNITARTAAIRPGFERVTDLETELEARGISVPVIVAGGTPGFPVYCGVDHPKLQLSPGTCVLHDAGYGSMFQEMNFKPAAMLLGRVIAKTSSNRLTLDIGSKSVASDPPKGNRLSFPGLPDAVEVQQSEEHLVIETGCAPEYRLGDHLLAVPTHICPTVALHRSVTVVENGEVAGEWPVTARDRLLTI